MSEHQKLTPTIFEILIAIASSAVLLMILVPNLEQGRSRTSVSRAKADMVRLSTAAEAYAVDHGGEYPSNGANDPGDPTGLEFPFERILIPLSTPIAYIDDSQITDPFGNLAYADLGGNHSLYFFHLAAHEGLIQILNTVLAFPSQDIQALTDMKYAIISVGPDRIAEFDRTQPPFGTSDGISSINHQFRGMIDRTTVYDPTNGGVSIGDIMLTSQGFLDTLPVAP